MRFGKLLGGLLIRSFLLGLAVALGIVVGMAALSAAQDGILSSKRGNRDIVFEAAPSCKGDTIGCVKQLHFNGLWAGVDLCRRMKCVKFEEVLGER